MVMMCRVCNRRMTLTEFLAYPTAYFLKVVAAVAVPFIISAISDRLKNPTRGAIDEGMSVLANQFSIECPNCGESKNPWEPAANTAPRVVKRLRRKRKA